MLPALPSAPSFRLDRRRALITGAGQGLGAAAAAALAEAGAEVVVIARTLEGITATAEAINARGGNARAVALDVTDRAAVAETLSVHGLFDILVNSAGTNRPMPMTAVAEEDYDAIFNLNVKAVFFVSKVVVSRLIAANRRGSIINITSQMGHVGAANRTVYCASKHAVEGLTKAMAVELAEHGIRVNSIAPTFIHTPMTAPFLEDPSFAAAALEKIKLGRLGVVEDIMGATLYLAGDASSLVTGTSLLVDGGWTAE